MPGLEQCHDTFVGTDQHTYVLTSSLENNCTCLLLHASPGHWARRFETCNVVNTKEMFSLVMLHLFYEEPANGS